MTSTREPPDWSPPPVCVICNREAHTIIRMDGKVIRYIEAHWPGCPLGCGHADT